MYLEIDIRVNIIMSMEKFIRNQEMIIDQLKLLRKEMNILKSDLKNINEKKNEDIIDFNSEFIDIQKSEILKSLKYHDVYYDCKILKKYYLRNKDNMPIMVINSRLYKYRYNNKWVMDYGGANIKNILCNNIRNIYSKYNTINNYDDVNIFILNQEHIRNISKPKYKNQLFKEFISEVLKNEK